MLLSYNRLIELIDQGVIDAPKEHVNAASIDITLGSGFSFEDTYTKDHYVNMAEGATPKFCVVDANQYFLGPGDFVLATSAETFNLPDTIACRFILRSSLARMGLDHADAGWCDPGWHNAKLTMELRNTLKHHSLVLTEGMRIGQMVFFETASAGEGSYALKGRYNNQETVQESKGV